MELHGDGHRYGTSSDRELPYVFELLVAAVARRREAREAAPGGAAEHALVVPVDLARALIANPVFRHKVGAHDLLVYALSADDGRLCEVTDDQLQHGDIMAGSSLIQLQICSTQLPIAAQRGAAAGGDRMRRARNSVLRLKQR